MPFNSVEYLVFFIVVLITSWLLIRLARVRVIFLLLVSWYFYASNNHWLILILLGSTQIDFHMALNIERSSSPARRKLFLLISLCANLFVLSFFKYANFFAQSSISIFNGLGYQTTWVPWDIALPVGISFYTFEAISYVTEVYRGQTPAERSWLNYSLYIAFFPHLIAGPIIRAADLLPQLHRRPKLDNRDLEEALFDIFSGLFKKMVLADFLAVYAIKAFDTPGACDPVSAWVGVLAFSFQIYYDFSGYSDIAIGCSRLLGIRLPINFSRPYAATSITDFWRRWHISLSTWLRDYLYVPLGGNRMATVLGVYRNLMITMLLGGLWHGAAWHFVIWGGLQGLLLSFERFVGIARDRDVKNEPTKLRIGRRLFVFGIVTICWIVFRSQNWALFSQLLGRMFDFNSRWQVTNSALVVLVICAVGFLVQLADEQWRMRQRVPSIPILVKALAYGMTSLLVVMFSGEVVQPFIYFQF